MKFSTGSSTMKQTVLVSPTQKNEAGAQSFPLRCGVTGFAGWSTGTFLIPVLSARTPFVLPAAALFRLLKKRLGSRVSGDTEQMICGKGAWPSFPPQPMVFSPCSS